VSLDHEQHSGLGLYYHELRSRCRRLFPRLLTLRPLAFGSFLEEAEDFLQNRGLSERRVLYPKSTHGKFVLLLLKGSGHLAFGSFVMKAQEGEYAGVVAKRYESLLRDREFPRKYLGPGSNVTQ
jgi:hypothetical protein